MKLTTLGHDAVKLISQMYFYLFKNKKTITMQFIDLLGRTITVTNLDAAISQADNFKSNQAKWYADRITIKSYWTDVYNKLMKLKANLKITNKET